MMAVDCRHVHRHGALLRVRRRLARVLDGRRLALALALLLAACSSSTAPATTAAGGNAIHYQLSLSTVQAGPIFVEGDTAFANDQFTFSRVYMERWIQMAGGLDGKAMKVTGNYGGNYMSGEGTIQNNAFVIVLDTTGNVTSAVITLTVPPAVAARLAAP
jgi:hypothetical protein